MPGSTPHDSFPAATPQNCPLILVTFSAVLHFLFSSHTHTNISTAFISDFIFTFILLRSFIADYVWLELCMKKKHKPNTDTLCYSTLNTDFNHKEALLHSEIIWRISVSLTWWRYLLDTGLFNTHLHIYSRALRKSLLFQSWLQLVLTKAPVSEFPNCTC